MKKVFTILFSIAIFIIITAFFYFQYETKETKLKNIFDQITSELNAQLRTNQMDSLELALVLSQNSALVNALDNDDEDLGYQILSHSTQSIKQFTHKNVRAQIITADYLIFARSWDTVYAGMPLGDYRTDLDYFKTHTTPRTSIEVGRRLGFKATVPIYLHDKLLGFMEVIDFFEPLTELFRAQGIDLYVLMDDKYFNTAIFMQENMTIDKYIVANTNYNSNHINVLKSINFKQLKATRIGFNKGRHIFYEPMKNGEGEVIGAFVFVLPDKYLDYFNDPEDDISFLINVTRSSLYKVEKSKRYQNELFSNYTPKELLMIQESIPEEYSKKFNQETYKKLEKFSKDELIQLLLKKQVIKRINGKIK
jgi:hypothetical protein